jgi:nitrite reductase/ring-hydroxylating ferredoxin subunit
VKIGLVTMHGVRFNIKTGKKISKPMGRKYQNQSCPE